MHRLCQPLVAICETALDAVIAIDAQGKVTNFSPAPSVALFGYKAEEVKGLGLGDFLIPPEHVAQHNAGIERFRKFGVSRLIGRNLEVEALHKDGTRIPIEMGLSSLRVMNNPFVIAFMRDISRNIAHEKALRLALERAEQANAAKSAVVAMLAHDMRTALSGVLGAAALLETTNDNLEKRELTATVKSSGLMLDRLLDDAIDLARMEAGEIDVKLEPIDPLGFLQEIARQWRQRIALAGCTLTHEISADFPGMILCDESRLRQIMDNLLTNAVKYAAGSAIHISIARLEEKGWQISFADDGPGFSQEAKELAFQPFSRPRDHTVPGAGLGLSIVRILTEKLGGKISLDTAAGKGSRFDILFPEGRCYAGSRKRVYKSAPGAHLPSGLNVLLVEDNATNRMIAQKMLQQLDCNTVIAVDGISGLELAESQAFDIILMDIDLPRMNGNEVIHRLRAGHGPNRSAPILAFTAFALKNQKEETLALGASGFLAKPVPGIDVLAQAINAALQNRNTLQKSPQLKLDAVLDREALESLEQTFGEVEFKELIEQFRTDLNDIKATTQKAQSDRERLRKAAHMATSVSGALGASHVQTAAKKLNHASQNAREDQLEEARLEFIATLGQSCEALAKFTLTKDAQKAQDGQPDPSRHTATPG